MKGYVKFVLVIGFSASLISASLIYFCVYGNKNGLAVSPLSQIESGKLVIDTDAGGDDAGAILLALSVDNIIQNFDVIAITCTYGNTYVKNVAINVLKILTIANRSDIPVYIGAHKPLLSNYTSDDYYGEDGMGDFDFDEDIVGKIDTTKHASVALVDLARMHAGNLTVMALGPLTNVALAMTLDPNFVNNVNRLWIMGASVHGIGNVAPNVEANFEKDPQSNFIVLNGTGGIPAVLFPWETARRAAIPMTWRTDVLGATNSRWIKFLNQAESKTPTDSIWKVADIMLSALYLWPKLITRTLVTNVTPVFDGAARGSVLVDYDNSSGKPFNVEIIEKFDVENFQRKLLDVFH